MTIVVDGTRATDPTQCEDHLVRYVDFHSKNAFTTLYRWHIDTEIPTSYA